MPKFTLVCDHSYALDTHVVSHTFTADHLDDVLSNMTQFLRGAGFYFDGELDINIDPVDHSEYYYDTERNK